MRLFRAIPVAGFLVFLLNGCSDTPADDDATSSSSPTPQPAAPRISVSGTSLDFGEVNLAGYGMLELNVANPGTAPLSLLYVIDQPSDLPGEPFSVSGPDGSTPPESLNAGAAVTLEVRFTPPLEASFNGVLHFKTNDESHPDTAVALTGTGVAGDEVADGDEDGFTEDVDCDDADASSYPGADELCDDKDNNCDLEIDETAFSAWADLDGDGHGDPDAPLEVCALTDGISGDETDCDDSDLSIYEGAAETCDGKDNDCDGQIDEEGRTIFYTDSDGDGHGDPTTGLEACSPGSGLVPSGDDCNDGDPHIYPGAAELCDNQDNNCDLEIDEGVLSTFYADQDADGYGEDGSPAQACAAPSGYVSADGDCADQDATRYPGALEACNGIDDDCDGVADNGVQLTWYLDSDGDGYGDASQSTTACSAPEGYVSAAGDCNDADPTINPAATEICDPDGSAPTDNDCDGQIDENVQITWYQDSDGDGHGIATKTVQSCSQPDGYAGLEGDCNDGDADIYNGAPETCDGKDNNCDSQIDEEGATKFYRDVDGDRHGDPLVSVVGCNASSGYVASGDDCNDRDAAIYPGALEVCNNLDDNCNAQIDEGATTAYYLDADQDGYGDNKAVQACSPPDQRYATVSGDCDDLDAQAYPGATERCNGKDDNCNSQVDEGGVKSTFYADADKDGYGVSDTSDPQATTQACAAPTGYVADNTDCNDSAASTHPNALETCNGVDDNCNTQTDEGVKSTFYIDADGDGYGVSGATIQACGVPAGYAAVGGDCNDQDGAVYPSALEVCNSKDDNCDGKIDEGGTTVFYRDVDQDGYGDALVTIQACAAPAGYVSDKTDCNDRDATVHPGASEVCDAKDNNCDGKIDEGVTRTWYIDADKDGYGDVDSVVIACSSPGSKYTTTGGDCDDLNARVHPGATEYCNGYDDDCNGKVDESDPTIDFTKDPKNCGGCFLSCDYANGTGQCSNSSCSLAGCATGWYNTDGNAANGCETYAPSSCKQILASDPTKASGTYSIDPDGPTGSTAPFDVKCDMVADGGGWTLISSVVNDTARLWNSLGVFTNGATFGALSSYQSADYKSPAHKTVKADDLLVRTEEYAFSFDLVLNNQSFGDFISSGWPGACNTVWWTSGADYVENLTSDQAKVFGLILRAYDNNASCFPDTNENAAVTFTTQSCCWTNGIGNCPNCGTPWSSYDHSMLKKSNITPAACTAKTWPCNDLGVLNGGTDCYDTSCKTARAEVWVR